MGPTGATGKTGPTGPTGAVGPAVTVYGTVSTAASTVAKTLSATNYVLYTGAVVVATFTYGNSATSATLNVGSSGAKNIRYNGANVPAYMIKKGDTVTMVYSGSYWNIVDFDDYGDLNSDYKNL
jgi:hypothetical protein